MASKKTPFSCKTKKTWCFLFERSLGLGSKVRLGKIDLGSAERDQITQEMTSNFTTP